MVHVATADSGPACRRVLIVEDNPALCEFLAGCLETAGFYPIQTHDGLSGWQAYSEQQPDLAVVDLSLPVMSGFRLLRLLRSVEAVQSPRTPLMVISGHDPQEAGEVINATRPEAYLVKPFGAERFLATVRGILQPHPPS
jgi:two-component system KDP operon response regulator KdpE